MSIGRVTLRNRRHAPAPSMMAASVSSAGMACRAPVLTRNMYGNPSHRLTPRTASFARFPSDSHAMSAPPRS